MFRRLASITGIALLLLMLPLPAHASHLMAIGFGQCDGPSSVRLSPGEVADIEVCLSETASPLAGRKILFVEEGPSPLTTQEATTDQSGKARITFSSPRVGTSHVMVCDSQQCSVTLIADWLLAGGIALPDQSPPPPPLEAPADAAISLRPFTSHLQLGPAGDGFRCSRGPAGAIAVPGGVDVKSVQGFTGAVDPKTSVSAQEVRITTGQNPLVGSVIFGEPVVVFASLVDPALGDASAKGSFARSGFNHVLLFWSDGSARVGKSELVFEHSRWRTRPAKFTAVLNHEVTSFFTDSQFDLKDLAAGVRMAGLCDGTGFHLAKTSGGASSVPSPNRPANTTNTPVNLVVGVGLLALIGALAMAVLRATEPPPGISVESPRGPSIRSQRADIRYDQFGRPIGYIDIVEMPDGSIRTIRTSISQEALMLRDVDFLDSADWEDPVFLITRPSLDFSRTGRVNSFIETVQLEEGTEYRIEVSNMTYDDFNRVRSYSRTTRHVSLGTSVGSRLENVHLSYDDDPPDQLAQPLELAQGERVERSELQLDDDGHVCGYVSMTSVEEPGELDIEASKPRVKIHLPRLLFEAGEALPDSPVFVSRPNQGLARARQVLIRWFRRHGCKVDLRLTDESQRPLGNQLVRFGGVEARLDARGFQTMWVLSEGVYPITVQGEFALEGFLARTVGAERGPSVPAGIVGWVVVNHVPGKVEASITIPMDHKAAIRG